MNWVRLLSKLLKKLLAERKINKMGLKWKCKNWVIKDHSSTKVFPYFMKKLCQLIKCRQNKESECKSKEEEKMNWKELDLHKWKKRRQNNQRTKEPEDTETLEATPVTNKVSNPTWVKTQEHRGHQSNPLSNLFKISSDF